MRTESFKNAGHTGPSTLSFNAPNIFYKAHFLSVHKIPFGSVTIFSFRLAKDGKTFLEAPAEQLAIFTARELRRQRRWTFEKIADELALEGHRPRGSRWYPMTVARMIPHELTQIAPDPQGDRGIRGE